MNGIGTHLSPYFGFAAFVIWFGSFFWYFYGGKKIALKLRVFLWKLRLVENPHLANKRRLQEEAAKLHEENARLRGIHQAELDAIGRPPPRPNATPGATPDAA